MPDPILMLEAVGVAAATAAALALLCAWPWRRPRPVAAGVGGVLGAGLGFLVGCLLLGARPQWPPREDQDRLLLVLWPATLGVELAAMILGRRWRGWAWVPRLLVAASAGWVLLYRSSYLTDLAGPGTREWAPAQAGLILGGLAVSLAAVWAALAWLARRERPQPGRWKGLSVPLAVALCCVGAAVTVMLSGYASGGQLGLPLAGALAGAALASLALAEPADGAGVVGLGVVGLFAVLVIGRFFGQLTWGNVALLLGAPLLGWLPELGGVRRVRPWLRGCTRVALTVVPVVVALVLARQKFVADSERSSPGGAEPSVQDYLDFGK